MPNLLPFVLIFLIWGSPILLIGVALYVALIHEQLLVAAVIGMFSPFIFSVVFVGVAGVLSIVAQSRIKTGIFPRDPFDKVYFWRRIYGTCWTQVYYFKPIYSVCLSIPILKKGMLKVFGYRGPSMKFTVYPDSWIRDLPILSVGESAYIANRSTVGTNLCLNDGNIFVDKVVIEDKALVGHLAMLAPGVKIRTGAEIGAGVTVGIRATIKEGAIVRPKAVLSHGVVIGPRADIGIMSHIGTKVKIGEGVKIPSGANIPVGAVINSDEEAQFYLSSETKNLQNYFDQMISKVQTVEDGIKVEAYG